MAVRSKQADKVSSRERTLIKLVGSVRSFRHLMVSIGGELMEERNPRDEALRRLMASICPQLQAIDDLGVLKLKEEE